MPTITDFLDRQNTLSPEFARETTARLLQVQTAIEFETIITGADSDNSVHIYVIRNDGVVQCFDSIGFAAIGWGENHASSEFMSFQYAPYWSYESALFLTYSAKRRAEAAPGVGRGTDMFFIEPARDYMVLISDDVKGEIENIYSEQKAKQMSSLLEAHQRTFAYVEQLRKAQATPPEQQAEAVEKELEQERVREGTQDGEPASEEG